MKKRIRPRQRSDSADVSVRSITIRAEKRADTSRQHEDIDSFADAEVSRRIIDTPYNLDNLSQIFQRSNILGQCVEAMVTNVVKFGYRVVPIKEGIIMDQAEKSLLESFIESPNTEESLVGMQAKKKTDFEKYGFGFIEVIRNARKKPSLLRHAKAYDIRLLKRTGTKVEVRTTVERGGTRSTVTEFRSFRAYVQISNGKKVYFKEFGDPRRMDYTNGRYETKTYKIKNDKLATELLHERQYSEDAYGVPKWIPQLPSLLGSREAEEVNMRYFEDNTVPPMILAVAGGRLTKQSFADLSNLLNAKGVGKDRQNQILLIEAIPETSGLDDSKGSVQLQVEKLSDVRPSDGLFKEYDEQNRDKVRSSWRLPPVVIGMSQDVNFATANVSAFLAETQVFMPDRQSHDEFFNKRFVHSPEGLHLQTVKVETKGPSVTNPDQVIKTLTAVNVMGGVTPRKAINIVNETMQLSLEQYPEKGEEEYETWMDMPMMLAQKVVANSTQQTGEGDAEDTEQDIKDQDIKDREKDGKTGVDDAAVENGSQ